MIQAIAPLNDNDLQAFVNGEIHDWYRIILGYSDKVVVHLIEEFQLRPGHRVLDPFCGTGTTLVECLKHGISSTGIDANPASCFASRVKTRWSLSPLRLLTAWSEVEGEYHRLQARKSRCSSDQTFRYLEDYGLIERGWICRLPLRKVIRVKHAIASLCLPDDLASALMLALMAELVRGASNVKFGPELYCGPKKNNIDVLSQVRVRVESMASDLMKAKVRGGALATVVQDDARELKTLLGTAPFFDAVITSPPYPTEHDYTRNARLELALLEHVVNLETLRSIKKTMVRSHTKGIYKGDKEHLKVADFKGIQSIAEEISEKVEGKTSGFQKLYPTVIREYFGGMANHLHAVYPLIKPGGRAAYVVGDQSSYARVSVPTAMILEQIAISLGFESQGIRNWRSRWSTTTKTHVNENILLLRKPAQSNEI